MSPGSDGVCEFPYNEATVLTYPQSLVITSVASQLSNSQSPPQATSPTWQIQLLYDGACPLCLREVDFLRKRDANRGIIDFVDIASETYSPENHAGIDYETAMDRIHAIRADGRIITNVAVFREIYASLGMGWIYAATRWPIIGPTVDWVYGWWAQYRLALTGRPPLAQLVAERDQRQCQCNA